ncbi:helix-turn-helix domain-containing protein [Catenuloplanes sp. NPDC051500]|uniref:helix-turn-helix domain-containing protein n=1 Tax=Catenuloplanes sp. NPDC051500 TaxID=3363959 RepID=UPI0037AF4ED4
MESGGRGVVDGAFRVLRALPDAGTQQQVARLAELTGLPRPTVYRLLGQLRDAGAVEFAGGRWELSSGLLRLARRVEPFAGLREPSATALRVLRAQTGATVSLVVPSEEAFVSLESVPGVLATPVDTRSGAAMPAFTAAGVLLGAVPPPVNRSGGLAVDHGPVMPGMTCYAAPVLLPGGGRAALQITSMAGPAERFAAPLHRAAAALGKHMASR